MSEQTEIQTYEILEADMPIVKKRLEKLNNRAAKLGCDPVEIVVHDEIFIYKDENDKQHRVTKAQLADSNITFPTWKFFIIEVKGAAPKLAGWTFIGTLDHYSLPGKVIVNTVPGHEVPKQYHNSEGVCDHCGFVRNRKETFVCENENGELKQIGRQCLKDFLGHNPLAILRFMADIDELCGEMKNGFGGGWRGVQYYPLKEVLTVTSAAIRIYGWVPRSKANVGEGRIATTSHVFDYFNPPRSTDRDTVREWRKFVEAIRSIEGADKEAEAAIVWLKEQPDSNEYMHNIKTIAEAGEITPKLLGYACSIVATYLRAMEALVEKAKKSNEWISGEEKDKIEMKITVTSARSIDAYWGAVRLFRMLDEKGRTIVWFCSGQSEMKLGGEYKIRGTIKKFDEYNGWKQTVVKRVKVLDTILEPRT